MAERLVDVKRSGGAILHVYPVTIPAEIVSDADNRQSADSRSELREIRISQIHRSAAKSHPPFLQGSSLVPTEGKHVLANAARVPGANTPLLGQSGGPPAPREGKHVHGLLGRGRVLFG